REYPLRLRSDCRRQRVCLAIDGVAGCAVSGSVTADAGCAVSGSVTADAGRVLGIHRCSRVRPVSEPQPDHGGPVTQPRPVSGRVAPGEGGRLVGGGQAQSDRDALTADAGPTAVLPVDLEA